MNPIWRCLFIIYFFILSNYKNILKNEPIADRHVLVEPANSANNPLKSVFMWAL